MNRIKIKILMLQRGILTQKALAERLGVNPSTITRLLKGQRKSRGLQKRIAEILGIPISDSNDD
ncbi:MAG: helix-turn-helix transcriptional regulator [Candidatus Binatia bacterium]